jgi:hypothetical protein
MTITQTRQGCTVETTKQQDVATPLRRLAQSRGASGE